MTFMSLREARRRGMALVPASEAPPDLVERGRLEIGAPFPAGRYLGEGPGGPYHVYDARLWRWSKWGEVGTCGPGRTLRRRCLVPTWRARRIMQKIARGQTLFGKLDLEVYRAMPKAGIGQWQELYGRYAPPPSIAAQQPAPAPAAAEPLAPWFVWAMLFGVGAVIVYASMPPEPPPRRRRAA